MSEMRVCTKPDAPAVSPRAPKLFTDPQRELIGTLLGERIITKPVHTELSQMIGTMRTTKDASRIINKLIKQPRKDPR